jgi:hypothetical protein
MLTSCNSRSAGATVRSGRTTVQPTSASLRAGATDLIHGGQALKFVRCANCGCRELGTQTSAQQNCMGVNARNLDPAALERVCGIRLFDGATLEVSRLMGSPIHYGKQPDSRSSHPAACPVSVGAGSRCALEPDSQDPGYHLSPIPRRIGGMAIWNVASNLPFLRRASPRLLRYPRLLHRKAAAIRPCAGVNWSVSARLFTSLLRTSAVRDAC